VKLQTAMKLVMDELERATEGHPKMRSPHEGFAILQEEVDELWTEVKANQGTTDRGVSEAVQTAAMAFRYLIDLCAEKSATQHERKVAQHIEKKNNPDLTLVLGYVPSSLVNAELSRLVGSGGRIG
jgi:hypothetical protein